MSFTHFLTRFGSGTSGGNSLMDHKVTNSVVTWILDALPDGKTRVTVVHTGIAKDA